MISFSTSALVTIKHLQLHLISRMSRGLSELEEEDASLSEATDRDIWVDEVGEDGEEDSGEVQGETGNEGVFAYANGANACLSQACYD